jgi:rod shape-determining protein MreC
VYDRKTVRRRRAVLGLLVAGALILLTAYFGESAGGGLHSVQRGVFSIVSPIQDGASRALKPFRDLVGWVGDTVNAKGELGDLRKQRNTLREQVASGQLALQENKKLRGLLDLDTNLGLKQYGPVTSRVIGSASNISSHTVTIDVGTDDGVRTGMPVIDGGGLVGQVSVAAGNASKVTLISDPAMTVIGQVSGTGARGPVSAAVGNPDDLVMSGLSRHDKVLDGAFIMTAGTITSDALLASPYPPGIMVGTVNHVTDQGTDTQRAHLTPAADLRRLDYVQVLTKRVNHNRPTQ